MVFAVGPDIEAMAAHKLVGTRVAAASHPNATVATLAALANDPSPRVRRVVAARPDTPSHALQSLATDPDNATREAAASNPNAPSDVLIALLSDRRFAVRWAATTNPAADVMVQRAACAAPDPDVRTSAGSAIFTARRDRRVARPRPGPAGP